MIFPNVAVIEVVPPESDVASPWDPAALLIDAMEGSEELHAATEVMSWEELSVKVPVALNCRVMPFITVGSLGVISSVTREAAVTLKEVEPKISPEVAVTVVVPAESACADPFEAVSLLIVAIEGSDELHVTKEVTS